jgi:hypothetical protein
MHRGSSDALAGVSPQRIVDHDADDTVRHQVLDDHRGQCQPDLVGRPAGTREEPMIAADVLLSDRPCRSDDFRHRMPSQVEQPARHQGGEARHRGRREAARELLQQSGK